MLLSKISSRQNTLATPEIANTSIALRAKHLNYGFTANTLVLKDLNFSVEKGEVVGITGPVGAGKSALIRLLCQEIEGYQGSLQIFGKEIAELTPRIVQTLVSCIPQKPFLFSGSIRHNLCLDKDFSDEQLISILDFVGLYRELRQADRTLDSWIGEWGVSLSGGQKQRLSLARALLRPKPILLLDDSFSAVDSITEKHIIDRLKDFVPTNTSIIWVAHRISTLKHCTRIITLENGVMMS